MMLLSRCNKYLGWSKNHKILSFLAIYLDKQHLFLQQPSFNWILTEFCYLVRISQSLKADNQINSDEHRIYSHGIGQKVILYDSQALRLWKKNLHYNQGWAYSMLWRTSISTFNIGSLNLVRSHLHDMVLPIRYWKCAESYKP